MEDEQATPTEGAGLPPERTDLPSEKQERRKSVQREVTDWIVSLIIALAVSFGLRAWVIEQQEIPSGSMEPTIMVGDHVMIDKFFWHFTGLKRGEIVVFDPPVPSDLPFIKRLIGLPGDTVAIHDGKVWVNGHSLKEPYIAAPPNYTAPAVKVPEGKLFFLGDNRNMSNDSHAWGFADLKKVHGVAWIRVYPFKSFGLYHLPEYPGLTTSAGEKAK